MTSLSAEKLPAIVPVVSGAQVHDLGVSYRVWAPDHGELTVRVRHGAGGETEIALTREAHGYFVGEDPRGRAGDRYAFVLDDGSVLPDPASRFQPDGVHGWSECIDARSYRWRYTSWRRPRWTGQSIYELHVGAFTSEGTFRAVMQKLDHLASLGVDAIELMPVADFPGQRNWGYDGVALYAPARCYGRPDDLRALVDAAHERGLAVILDVVYNHLGPDGNYLARFARGYFDPDRHTPWGQAFHLAGKESRPVRDFFVGNAIYWLEEFHVDGLRLDATHAITDPSPNHLLAEIAGAVHERGGFVIAEDERNTTEILRRPDGSGVQLDATWSDDFHHQVRVAITGIQAGYFQNYQGTAADLARTIKEGWFYTGQPFASWKNRARGEPGEHLPTDAFVNCIENHDQVGNRACGERLEHLVNQAGFRAASALLLLSPYPPMLFMGQEWAASSPFLFFTDHHGELGKLVGEGRKKEFTTVGINAGIDPETVPDPQLEETFQRSKLKWCELDQTTHAETLALYRECFRQRREWLHSARERGRWTVTALEQAIALHYRPTDGAERLVVCALTGDTRVELTKKSELAAPSGHEWTLEFDSNAVAARRYDRGSGVDVLYFATPATVLLVAQPSPSDVGGVTSPRESAQQPGEVARPTSAAAQRVRSGGSA
jgi:maltooligosyltrehalose trehalohydrolase